MAKKILVIGSINADYTLYLPHFPLEGETLQGYERKRAVGGKGANQAVAAKRAGADVAFLCAIGPDDDGDYLFSALQKEGLSNSGQVLQETETGNATIFVDGRGQNEIVIIAGANGKLDSEILEQKKELIESSDLFVLQNEIPEKSNEIVIEQAYQRGKIVLYNPAPFRPIPESLYPKITYLTPNETELFRLTRTKDEREGAEVLLNKGVASVLVTLGSRGSYYRDRKGEFFCPATLVTVVDSVGAGDTFMGYFAAMIAEGKDVPSAMRIASKAASISVTRKGALPSIPYREEVLD